MDTEQLWRIYQTQKRIGMPVIARQLETQGGDCLSSFLLWQVYNRKESEASSRGLPRLLLREPQQSNQIEQLPQRESNGRFESLEDKAVTLREALEECLNKA
jgi:hypothetical protein